jgi:type II secretory pathway component PulM
MMIGLGTILAVGITFMFAVRPAIDRTKTLQRVIPEKHERLEELRIKANRLIAIRQDIDNLQIDSDDSVDSTSLIAALESMTNNLNLADKLASMTQSTIPLYNSNYSEIVVQAEFKDVTLDQLVKFLVETSRKYSFLRTTSLHIKTSTSNPNLLDSSINISALKANPKT